MAAANHLQHVTKGDIQELKSLLYPPAAVKLVFEAVCIIKGIKPKGDNYWIASKQMMADPNVFLDSLKTFDKKKVTADTIEIIRTKYLSDPSFNPERIRSISKACEGLCRWVIAIAE